jgi:hypothetical protein
MYPVYYLQGVLTVQLLARGATFWNIPVLAILWVLTKFESIRCYTDSSVWQCNLGSIHQRYELTPVVLVVIHKWSQSLIDIFVHNFSLAIGLLIVRSRKLDLNSNDTTKLILKGRNELGTPVRDNRFRRMTESVYPLYK